MDIYKSMTNMEAFLDDWMQKSFKMTSELPNLSEDEMKANVQILYSGREHKEKTGNWKNLTTKNLEDAETIIKSNSKNEQNMI